MITVLALTLALLIAAAVPSTAAAQELPEASPPDSALAAWLRAQGVSPDSARVIDRAAMSPHLEAVLVGVGPAYLPDEHLLIAMPTDATVPPDAAVSTDTTEWRHARGARAGDQPAPWRIAHIPERWDDVALDVVGPTSVIVRITGSYGQEFYRQYFLDLRSRTVSEMWEYRDPEASALLVTADTLYAVYLFRDVAQYFLKMPLYGGEMSVTWMFSDEPVQDLVFRADTLYALTAGSELWRRGGVWVGRGRSRPLQPSEGVRLLHPRLPQFRIVPGGIVEMRLGDSLFIPLDLPDFDDFVRARPEHDHYGRMKVEIATEIGPTAAHEGRVWFGLTFYDGEGYDGVGGIGWFDPKTREARMIYPEPLADWSVSAIEGQGASIYVGLVARHEGSIRAGGLGRYDVQTGAFRILDIPGPVGQIAVHDGTIYALTAKGLVVLAADGEFLRLRVIPGRELRADVMPSRGRVE